LFNSFPLCRTIFDHWIYADSDYLKIWITMLGKARYLKDTKTGLYQNVKYTLNYGQFIFGRLQWSKDLNIGEQKLRTCIKKLMADNMIKVVDHASKFTIYEIENYAKFNQQDNQQETKQLQGFEGISNQQNNQQITSKQPADNQQITTNKESKESKESIIVLGADEERFINVLKTIKNYPLDLTKDRELYLKLSEKYPSLDLVKAAEEWAIYKLDTPLKANSNARSQFNTSCSNAVKWGKCTKQKVAVGQAAKVVMFNFDED
jgi:hypothetical protein